MELIDKTKLLKELKKCEKICEDYMLSHKDAVSQGIANAKRAVCQHIIKFLDTFNVKEVNLEKEIYDAEKRFGDIDEMGGYRILIFDDEFRNILRHFFELGLKTQKGE